MPEAEACDGQRADRAQQCGAEAASGEDRELQGQGDGPQLEHEVDRDNGPDDQC